MQGTETREREVGALLVPESASTRAVWLRRGQRKLLPHIRVSVADAMSQRRVFVLLPFSMILGLVTYAGLPGEPESWALWAVGAGISFAIVLLARSSMVQAFLLFACGWLGFCLLPLHASWFGTPMLVRPAYGFYEARVDEVISATPEAQRIVISSIIPVTNGGVLPIVRARLVAPPEPMLAPGDMIQAEMRLAPVAGPVLPGAFDSQFHAYFAGIGAYGNVTGEFERVATGAALDPTRGVEALRMAIGARVDAVLDGPSAAIGRAMVVGDQSAISDETREVMAKSGLAHIYSISGLHLSIVAGGIFFLLRLALACIPAAATQWPVKKIAAGAGILAALSYLLLAGGLANVPALRSTIMLGLIFGAILAGRRALTMRNVAIAAIAVILLDPASVFRASFQLSFAAVVALIGVYEMPRRVRDGGRSRVGRMWAAVWTTAATSFIAGTATLLFSAYHFQQTAPLGVLGNVLVLPVVSLVVMPFAVLSVLAMPFGAEAPFVRSMGWGIDRMIDGATLVATWSEGWTGNPLLTSSALLIGLAALAWFAFINSWWRLAGPLIALPLILLIGLDQRPDILISDTTQAVAMRTGEGMGLVTGKAGSFAVDVWGEHYQEAIAETVPEALCDQLGCIAQTERYSVAVIRNAAAFAEDCGMHNVIIARVRAPTTCQGGQIIDADDLARGGVHWLRWDEVEGRFEIRTAIPNLTRPWRVVPR